MQLCSYFWGAFLMLAMKNSMNRFAARAVGRLVGWREQLRVSSYPLPLIAISVRIVLLHPSLGGVGISE
jgi:hypothetical protein